MREEKLIFYPEHPSDEITKKIATTPSPVLEQRAPIDVTMLYKEFFMNFDEAWNTYKDKRFEVTGIASKVGPDIRNLPSIELSDKVGGQCHVLCIFPNEEFYSKVTVGDKITIRGNYMVMCNLFGIVMKHSELV